MCAITGDMSVDHDTGRSNDIPEEGFMCIMSAIPVGRDRDQSRVARYTYTVHRWQSPDRPPGRDHQGFMPRTEEHNGRDGQLLLRPAAHGHLSGRNILRGGSVQPDPGLKRPTYRPNPT